MLQRISKSQNQKEKWTQAASILNGITGDSIPDHTLKVIKNVQQGKKKKTVASWTMNLSSFISDFFKEDTQAYENLLEKGISIPCLPNLSNKNTVSAICVGL